MIRGGRLLKAAVFLAGPIPAAWLLWAALTGHLSANPLSDVTNETGIWTLISIAQDPDARRHPLRAT